MPQHPGLELQDILKEKGLTQKAFSVLLGKKISEVNELLKGKRNITIRRDFLLHKVLGTPIKYRILKQIDYEYTLILDNESNINKIQKTNEQQETNNTQEIENIPTSESQIKLQNSHTTNQDLNTTSKNVYNKNCGNNTTKQDGDIDRIKIFREF